MLKNINSVYFLKNLYSNINDRRKLKIIKYNKSLQNKIGINLLNYEFFSNRVIIYETNRRGKKKGKDETNGRGKKKGKEYYINSNQILYEGEFLNGERNGKGKEYNWCRDLIFKGEYFKGKRWNGEGYNIYKKIIYKLKDGKGYVRNYDFDDNLIYEGEYLNGEKNGKGKEYYWDNILAFEGEYLNGKKWNGKGYNKNKMIYQLKDGKGSVEEYDKVEIKLIFKGEYLNGEKNGKGKEYYKNGNLIFEGEYLNGRRNGKGKEYNEHGNLIYEGEYLYGRRNGKGKEYNEHGNLIYEGEYLYGSKRFGNMYMNDRLEFKGEFLFDKKFNGKGFDENGKVIYELNKGTGNIKEYDYYKIKGFYYMKVNI